MCINVLQQQLAYGASGFEMLHLVASYVVSYLLMTEQAVAYAVLQVLLV